MNGTRPEEVVPPLENIDRFPKFKRLHDEGKIIADRNGRFRYSHGAPVGKLILRRVNEDGTRVYSESAEEWFDPSSPKAKDFVWPE